MSRNYFRGRDENNSNNIGFWGTAAVVGTIAGAAALAYSYWNGGPKASENPTSDKASSRNPTSERDQGRNGKQQSENSSRSNGKMSHTRRGIPRESVPEIPMVTNLNSLLHDIYLRYIALNDDEFTAHYRVFNTIFTKLLETMKEVDPYFNKYSSRVQFAGSHYDRLRIKKPDEFDMDIVIGLPLNLDYNPVDFASSDIIIEPKGSGYVQLKMGVQFKNLPKRDLEQWIINRAAYEWKDERDYLLRDKFANWFKSVVDKALNKHPCFYVDGVSYTVDRSESGPAKTLLIKNESKGFKMDVDLVPALKFPERRWPPCSSYRNIPPGCNAKQEVWMVVPKANKNAVDEVDKLRSWRIAMHDQERGLMYHSENMKQTIRLMKKLRDSLEMKPIASYYVKTLFFWMAEEKRNEPTFWRKSVAELFQIMVGKFHDAMMTGNIPYFWNKRNNLIGNVNRETLNRYAIKLAELKALLEMPGLYKQVAKYLLTPEEFAVYRRHLGI